MATRTIGTILNLKDNFSNTIKKTTNNTKAFQRQLKHTQNQAKQMKDSINGAFKGVALKAGGVIAGLGLVNFAKDSLNMASSLQEVANVIDTTFGSNSNAINEWSRNALKQFGLGELQAKEFNGTLGAMLKTSGFTGDGLQDMTTKIAGLSGDIASFRNMAPEEAFEKLKSIVTGSSEPVEALGLDFRVASLESYAMSKGIRKAYKDMSNAEQIQLRYNYTMEKTVDMQGDFSKTGDSYANQLRVAQTQFKQLGASIMTNVLPYANKLLIWSNNLMTKAPQSFAKVKTKAMELWNTFNVTGKLSIVKTQFKNVFNFIKSVIDTAKTPALNFVDSIKGFAQTIWTDIQPALIYLKDNIDISEIGKKVKDSISGILDIATNTFNFINDNWSTIKPLITGIAIAWGGYKAIMLAQQGVTTLVTAAQWALNVALNANPIGLIVTGIGLLIGAGILLYKNWDTIKEKAGQLWSGISAGFKGFINFTIDGINKLIEGFNNLTGFKLPDWIPGIGGKGFDLNIPKIPNFATGTSYTTAGLIRQNERGGELAIHPNGTAIIPADKTDKILNKQGGVNVYVTIQGNVIGNETYADELGEHIVGKVKLALANL